MDPTGGVAPIRLWTRAGRSPHVSSQAMSKGDSGLTGDGLRSPGRARRETPYRHRSAFACRGYRPYALTSQPGGSHPEKAFDFPGSDPHQPHNMDRTNSRTAAPDRMPTVRNTFDTSTPPPKAFQDACHATPRRRLSDIGSSASRVLIETGTSFKVRINPTLYHSRRSASSPRRPEAMIPTTSSSRTGWRRYGIRSRSRSVDRRGDPATFCTRSEIAPTVSSKRTGQKARDRRPRHGRRRPRVGITPKPDIQFRSLRVSLGAPLPSGQPWQNPSAPYTPPSTRP